MYWYKRFLFSTVLLAGMIFSPFSVSQAEAAYQPSGDEIAGVRVHVGGGYHGRYHRWGPYRGGYHYPGYYRHGRWGRYGPYRGYYRYPGYYGGPYYHDDYWYRYGRPRGGVYFHWRK